MVALQQKNMDEKEEVNGCFGLFIAGLVFWGIVITLILLA